MSKQKKSRPWLLSGRGSSKKSGKKSNLKVKKNKKKKPVKTRKFLAKKKVKVTKKFKAKKKIIRLKSRKKILAKRKNKIKRVIKRSVTRKNKKKVIKRKKVSLPKVKKYKTKTLIPEFLAESLFKARIKVIGIGGGGGSIVSEIGRSLQKATFVIADTDIRALKKRPGIKYFWFGGELTHGLGTGVDINLGKRAAESAKEKMSGIFKDQDIIIFIASLGGGLGSGATQVFAETAKKMGAITVGIFTMPFRFEGANKQRIAQNTLKSLRQSLNVSLVIPNEKIFKIINANTPITNAFSTVNKSLIESLESLIDLIYNPGVINIDFADLRTILKGIGNFAFLNTVEESGKDRAEKICKVVLVNPLLQNNKFQAEKILFNIAGSENLSMFEVEKISRYISDLNPKSKIIFGISKNPKLKNKIKTTILMTGGGVKEKEIITEEKAEKVLEISKITGKNKDPKVVPTKKIVVRKALKNKKVISKKQVKKTIKKDRVRVKNNKEVREPVSFIPVSEVVDSGMPVLQERKMTINQGSQELAKKTIRRSGLEIKKAEEQEEKKKIQQEKEWEIPAFLRRVKYKS